MVASAPDPGPKRGNGGLRRMVIVQRKNEAHENLTKPDICRSRKKPRERRFELRILLFLRLAFSRFLTFYEGVTFRGIFFRDWTVSPEQQTPWELQKTRGCDSKIASSRMDRFTCGCRSHEVSRRLTSVDTRWIPAMDASRKPISPFLWRLWSRSCSTVSGGLLGRRSVSCWKIDFFQ